MINWYRSDVQLDYSDVLMVPKQGSINSRSEVELPISIYKKWPDVVPIIASNMDHVGTFEMARTLSKYRVLTCLVKHYKLEELVCFYKTEPDVAKYCIYSMGANQQDFEKLKRFTWEIGFPNAICIDVANAYANQIKDFVEAISESTKEDDCVLIVGNVVTPDIVLELVDLGVDIVKVGIGPGSVCTTRLETGIGYPQFSAIAECYEAAHYSGVGIIADGGITCPGDAAKAFGVGADFVMLGGELAGHDEGYTDLDLLCNNGQVEWYGMASETAQRRHNGGLADYRSSEGVTTFIPKRGPVENTIKRYLNGLRSACSYLGTKNTMEMRNNARFVRVNNQRNRSMV